MAAEDVIEAYCRIYTALEIKEALSQALADRLTGVQITNVSFEGGSSSGAPISGAPDDLIAILNACLDRFEGKTPAAPVAHWDFSKQALGT